MRGKVDLFGHLGDVPRITPAHAGKSCPACTSENRQKDHPRACGEKSLTLKCGESLIGSPPRMRGKAEWANANLPAMGITPAHAGKRVFLT